MAVRSSPLTDLTRRRFLQKALLGATATALPGCTWRLADIQNQVGAIVRNTDQLNLYTWSSYISDDLIQSFQRETGVKGVTEIMASNEEMIAAFEAGKGRVFSLLYPSDYAVALMQAKRYLQPLDVTRIDDLETLLPNLAQVGVIDGQRYSVPITWGTTGILYNRDKLPVPPTDWADLWNNKTKLTRKFTLLDDAREVMGMVLHHLGYSQNTTDLGHLEQAYKQLQILKPHLANFTTDAWREPLLAGDLWMAMAYSTDATELMQENPQIRYVIPPSGTNLWVDTMVIPVTAPNPKSAYAWINYVMNPERAAQLSEKLGYVPTTQAAIDRLPEAVRQDPIKFPPVAILAKCETMQSLPEAVTTKIDQYWTQIKT